MKITYSPGSNTDVIEVTQTETLLDGRTRGISASDGKPPQLVDVDVCVCVCVCVRALRSCVCALTGSALSVEKPLDAVRRSGSGSVWTELHMTPPSR